MSKLVDYLIAGFNHLSSSSRGEYNERTESIKEIRREMLEGEGNSFKGDKENLMNDKRRISSDVKKSFDKIILQNG